MIRLLENYNDLLLRGCLSGLQGGRGLQKGQSRTRLQLGEEIQSDGIVGFETGSELVHQVRLHLNQGILIAGEGFEFSDFLANRGETT
jgi:hypothetical protein